MANVIRTSMKHFSVCWGGGYSTLSWVRMCGPKFRPPPYNNILFSIILKTTVEKHQNTHQMEEMQQIGEAWKVLHHLYITYKEKKSLCTTQKQLSHSYPLTPAHHTAKHSMSQKQQRKGTENLHECCIEMKPTSLDHLTCLKKIKARNTRNTTDKSFRIYVRVWRNDVRLSLNVLTLLEDFTSRGNKFQNFGLSIKIDLILWISKR